MNYPDLLNKLFPELSKSEKKVADFTLAYREDVIYGTMQTIKDGTGVGDATIIRFCQKLGYSGFTDLKIALAKEDFSQEERAEKENNYYNVIANQLITAITATEKLIDSKSLAQAIKFLSEKKHLYLLGVGHSGETAKTFEKSLLRVGILAKSEIDTHFQAQLASMLGSDDLVIGISLSGQTADLYNSLKVAKANGAKIIAITNNILSPIAQLADVTLQTAIAEFLNGGSLSGQLSQLYICEILLKGYEQQNNVDTLAFREKALRSILNKRIDN